MARPKIYNINENYFERELSKNGAYLLGLILSDGYLNFDRGQFQYVCKNDDIELLNFIKSELESTHPLRKVTVNGIEYCRLSISNIKLVQSLINKFNLPHKNKSCNNLSIPTISKTLLPHFLRGIFDGDGSIWKSDCFCAAFSGGESFLKEIKNIILNDIGIDLYFSYRHAKNNKNSCSITTKGNINITKLYHFLYKESDFYLKRKHNRFLECLLRPKNRMSKIYRYNGTAEKIKGMYKNGISQKSIAISLKVVYSSVRSFIQRERKEGNLI